ncbi:MAG: hypothetical protein ACLQDI_04900 [Syntrophobacteraceae bacterium]
MQKIIMFLCCLLLPLLAVAETIELPIVKPGDSWTYRDTIEKGQSGWVQKYTECTVIRAGVTGILLSMKEKGSTQAPKEQLLGKDWSRFRNINGKETVVNQPFLFQLKQGKSWKIEYTEDHPNKGHKTEQIHTTYSVIGWEDVDVPSGHFKAIKVEAEGKWIAELEPSIKVDSSTQANKNGATVVMQSQKVTPQSATGRLYKAFWYVPEIKRFVKSVEEYYNAGGIRNERYTDELDSFKVSQ